MDKAFPFPIKILSINWILFHLAAAKNKQKSLVSENKVGLFHRRPRNDDVLKLEFIQALRDFRSVS